MSLPLRRSTFLRGLLDRTDAPQSYVVSGQVLREGSLPMRGVKVRAFDESERGAIRLGEDTTDAEGRYTIRYELLPGVDGINLRVAVFDADDKRLHDSDVIRGAQPLEIVDLKVPSVDTKPYQVEGKVASRVSADVGGLRVVIVDRGVGGDVPLAETHTAEGGAYQVTFSDSEVRRRGKAQPDLQARVFAGDVFLGTSDVHYNATQHETLNVLLEDKVASALRSEHELLTSVLASQFTGKLRDLKETDEQQDITYLANKTGWDARAVALAALSDQFSQQGGIPASFFYALFRAGLPANEDTLYHTDAKTLETVWKKAAEQGVIPTNSAEQIPHLIGQFQALSAQKLLTGPASVGVSSFQQMLAASLLDVTQQKRFAELYTVHRNDMPRFWDAVGVEFGKAATRLQVDGKLGFLTINNVSLMNRIHTMAGGNGLSDPLQLAQMGYHRAEAWSKLLTADISIPKEIPGDTSEEKRGRYAGYLAAQVRLSYPTAAVAYMVKYGDPPLTGAAKGVSDDVHAFLTEHQGKFEIGVHPVDQYIARNKLDVPEETKIQIRRVQRVYQITPSDQAMIGLMTHGTNGTNGTNGIDAAYHVVRYEKEVFVQAFAQELGGEESAAQTYDKSVQVHNAVLNIALSYLSARIAPGIGQSVAPMPAAANASDVIANATLEKLFGEMDFCACDHCRSILSPAAYLVDLLLFLNSDPKVWADYLKNWPKNHATAPYPFANQKAFQEFQSDWNSQHPGEQSPNTEISPFDVLMSRRPDIEYLPLTCENTNTALPYIDVVNETLEYFIANDKQKLSLTDYLGHDTDGAASADLLASPQFVLDSAYNTLRGELFPAPLPFHQPLEYLRRYFDKFGAPLPLVMERHRKSNDLERGANPYGWRDVLMEEIGLSRTEYDILTTSNAAPNVLWEIYGYLAGTPDVDIINGNETAKIPALSNAKQFTRRVGITYEEIIAILKTRFVNPNSDLIPKLERLRVPFATLKALKDGTITDAAFDALLLKVADAPDPLDYGGDIKAWVKNAANYARIMGLITLTDPDPKPSPDPCSFDTLEFRYAKPMTGLGDLTTRLGAVEFVRLLRFIRLWRKLGWTIEQTDAAICALFPMPPFPLGADAIDTVAKLDAGFLALLPRLGIVARVMKALNLTPKRDLLPLLACWSEIGTHGDSALYRQMFLNPALLNQDAVFADNGYGEFLPPSSKKLADHAEALRSAFNLTGDEYDQIVAVLRDNSGMRYDANTPLTIPYISAIYRRGWLARKTRLSVRELLALIQLTGLDPFAIPDPTNPAIVRLIELVQAMNDRSLKSPAALYLIWNQDLSGKSAPDPVQVTELARTLRGDFAGIEDQFAASEDPGGDVARARMTLVYGQEAADAFFVLLDDTLVLDVSYTYEPWPSTPPLTLDDFIAAITAKDLNIAYDDFRHRLSHTGILIEPKRNDLKALPDASEPFIKAVEDLYTRGEDVKGSFFTRYPELKPLYDSYRGSNEPVEKKRAALLAAFRPELSRRRKRQQALARLSAAAGVDLALAQTLLDPSPAPLYPLHAAGHPDQPVLDDVLALETPVDVISGNWRGWVETPEPGYHNFIIQADASANPTVILKLDGLDIELVHKGNLWRNKKSLELQAGRLYDFELATTNVTNPLSVKWETPQQPRQVIPARYLYPPTISAPFSAAYTRFLKATALAATLRLTASEIAYLATHADFQVGGDGWLNALAVTGDPDSDTAKALLVSLQGLLDFARIKAALAPNDERLLAVLRNPAATLPKGDNLLLTLTHWESASLDGVIDPFRQGTRRSQPCGDLRPGLRCLCAGASDGHSHQRLDQGHDQ